MQYSMGFSKKYCSFACYFQENKLYVTNSRERVQFFANVYLINQIEVHTIPKVVLQINFHFRYKSTMYLYLVNFFQVQSTIQAKLAKNLRVQEFFRFLV